MSQAGNNPNELAARAAAQADALLASVQAGTIADTPLGITLPEVVNLIGMVAGAVIPGASLAGFTIAQLVSIGAGVAKAVPQAIEAFGEIKAAAQTGQRPTPEQIAKWNAAADAANAAAGAAEDRVLQGSGQ